MQSTSGTDISHVFVLVFVIASLIVFVSIYITYNLFDNNNNNNIVSILSIIYLIITITIILYLYYIL